MHRLFAVTLAFVVLHVILVVPIQAEVKLKIGPDTTVIDGPMNEDGTINYLAYLNEKLSEGVTAENNFAVDVARVMPPAPEGWSSEVFRGKVFEKLGVEKPVDGPYWTTIRQTISPDESIQFDDPRFDAWKDVISDPWQAEDHPQIKQWLDKQAEVLDRITVTSDKPHCYFPLVVEEGQIDAVSMRLLPWLGTMRSLGRGFKARAELNIASGDLDAAWSDVKAIHRIGNHCMRSGDSITWLVGVSLHAMAFDVYEDIAGCEHLNASSVKKILADYEKLIVMPPYGKAHLSHLRFEALDTLMHGLGGRGDRLPDEDDYTGDIYFPSFCYAYIDSDQYDPNMTFRAVNEWMEMWVTASQIEDYHERMAVMQRLSDNSLLRAKRAMQLTKGDPDAALLMQREIRASNKTTAIVTPIVVDFTFGARQYTFRAQQIIKMKSSLAWLAIGIAGYHAEHGEYPADLNALVPGYLEKLPVDFATGELPVYRVEDGVAVVYSFGADLDDDGGTEGNTEDGDILVRVDRR